MGILRGWAALNLPPRERSATYLLRASPGSRPGPTAHLDANAWEGPGNARAPRPPPGDVVLPLRIPMQCCDMGGIRRASRTGEASQHDSTKRHVSFPGPLSCQE